MRTWNTNCLLTDSAILTGNGKEDMVWIIGSMVLILWGIVMMCFLIAGGRADDKMINNDWMESNKKIELYEGGVFYRPNDL